ncbi:MAG: GntR family transcriptional regulator [Roseinatronobacter sp.]
MTRPVTKLSQQALEQIRARIVDGTLALGEAISETSLAASLQVSKTPVREALQELKREGLVQIFPKRGTFVFEASPELVRELSDFRLVLETAALERAMVEAWGQLVDHLEPIVAEMHEAIAKADLARYRLLDAALHRGIIKYCGNSFLKDAHAAIEFRVQALRTRLSTASENNNRTMNEHEALIKAIADRDPPRALEILCHHISQTRESYLSQMC